MKHIFIAFIAAFTIVSETQADSVDDIIRANTEEWKKRTVY